MAQHDAPRHDILYDLVLANRGAVYEGDVFHALRSHRWTFRSFEFGMADGGLDCTIDFEGFAPYTTWAERFFLTEAYDPLAPRSLLLFDIKSTVSAGAGEFLIASDRQHQGVAFFICVRSADPGFVELVPNLAQNTEAVGGEGKSGRGVDFTRSSRLPPSAYRLDPATAPYRMPLRMLHEALDCARMCALGIGIYTNPWTRVAFPQWRPTPTSSTLALTPAQDTAQFTAYQIVHELHRVIRSRSSDASPHLELDFVGLQPRLADFKLIVDRRQHLIQHKADTRARGRDKGLSDVPIARGSGPKTRWYFSAFDRFDFVFYQFFFTDHTTDAFFLPEKLVPDHFFDTTTDTEVSFDRKEFESYRFTVDTAGSWVERVIDIIGAHPSPRAAARPARTVQVGPLEQALAAQPAPGSHAHGYSTHHRLMTELHRKFFYGVLQACCDRYETERTVDLPRTDTPSRSGLLVLLDSNHPRGDFVFCRYQWTPADVRRFQQSRVPPRTLSDLPAWTPVVPIFYFSSSLECTVHGPQLTFPQFRRLNASSANSLCMWNLWGLDEQAGRPLVVIPSEDIRPSSSQRSLFQQISESDRRTEYTLPTPLVSWLLSSGLTAAHYTIGSRGPLVYEDDTQVTGGAVRNSANTFTKCSSSTLTSTRSPFTSQYLAVNNSRSRRRRPQAVGPSTTGQQRHRLSPGRATSRSRWHGGDGSACGACCPNPAIWQNPTFTLHHVIRCLLAFSSERLVGRSAPIQVKHRKTRRQSIAISDIADAEGPWFDGVEYLKAKEPGSSFVTQAKRKSIGIIGGGMSGLMTSLILTSVGIHNWRILEASHRVGGRVHTTYLNHTRPDQYQYQEMGPMRFPVSVTYPDTNETIQIQDHRLVFQVADTLNKLNGNSSKYAVNFIPWIQQSLNQPANTAHRRPDGTIPGAAELAANPSWKTDVTATYSNATAVEAASAAYEDFVGLDRDKIREVATNVFKAHKAAVDAGIFDFSEAGYIRYALGQTWNITDEADGSGLGDIDPGWFYDDVYFSATKWRTIDQGLSRLPHAFEPHVLNRTTFGVAVSEMKWNATTKKMTVGWRKGDPFALETSKASFDYTIVAVPFSKVRGWRLPSFSSLLSRAIRTLNYAQSCKVALHYTTRFWEHLPKPIFGGCGSTNIPLLGSVCFPSYRINSTGPGVVLGSYASGVTARTFGSYNETEHVAYVQRAMVEALGPQAAEQFTGAYDRICWEQNEFQAGAWAAPTLAQQPLYLPAFFRTEFNTVFIGEHTSYTHAWIFSALESAVRGSTQLLLEMGLVDEAKEVVDKWMARWISV